MSKTNEYETLEAYTVIMRKTEHRCYRCTAAWEYHITFRKKKELRVYERCCNIVNCWTERGYDYEKILTLYLIQRFQTKIDLNE